MMSVQKKLKKALSLHQQGHLVEAAELYQDILRSDPNSVDALNLLGVILQAAGDLEAAVTLIRRATELAPDYASPYVNLGNALQVSGKLAEAAESFERACQLEPNKGEPFNNLASVLNEMDRYFEAREMAEKAVVLAPALGAAHNNLGSALLGLGEKEASIECYRRAISLDRADATSHYNLGNALTELGKPEEALASYRVAVSFDDRNAEKFYNLANTALQLDLFDEALKAFDRALAIDPDYTDAYCNRGAALQKMGQPGKAVDSLQAALARDPDSPDLHWNLSLAMIQSGDLENGFKEYEWRWKTPTFADFKRDFPMPRWDGSDPSGKTVFVDQEQGFGDALQFCRFVPQLAAKGANVIVECRPGLKALLESLDGIGDVIDFGQAIPAADYHVPMMSLPFLLGATLEDIPTAVPYLKVPEGTPVDDRLTGEEKKKIGFAWAGSPTRPDNHKRSCSVTRFEGLLDEPGARFFSLQVGPFRGDLEKLDDPSSVIDLAEGLSDFAHTAAAIDTMDLVISVDTSVLHVAAALGKPTWDLMPNPTGFFWMDERTDSPWYPTVRLFRQPEPGDWESVFRSVEEALPEYLSG